MRLGRASDNAVGREGEDLVKILATPACPDPDGWVCNQNAEHFRPSDSRLLTLVPRAC